MEVTVQSGIAEKRKKTAAIIYYAGLMMLVTGMPLSMFLMSVSQFVLLGSWIIEGNLLNKLKQFFSNKVCLALFTVYLLHLIGLLYTTDFDYAFRDLRIKLPLLLLPLLFFTGPSLTTKQFFNLLKLFLVACLLSSLVSTAVWLQIIDKPVNDIRDISIFISHIRLSLLISVAVFIAGFFAFNKSEAMPLRILAVILILWFIGFLVILQSFTGLAAILATLIILSIKKLIETKRYLSIGLIVLAIISISGWVSYYVFSEIQLLRQEEVIDLDKLPATTSRGNAYTHERFKGDVENGHRIYMFVCYNELDSAWNTRSSVPYSGLDKKGQYLKYTLIRYMTSKGLHKDADGIEALTSEDIKNIENGIGSINELKYSGIRSRIRNTIWELNNYLLGANASGHTLSMRFEFWKASFYIIKNNLLFGVGTGDNQLELYAYYQTNDNQLSKQWWLRSHNQFLALGVSFGMLGIGVFLFSILYPILSLEKYNSYFYLTFFSIAILSFMTEDTLETQAGVTFFAFFNSFFLLNKLTN